MTLQQLRIQQHLYYCLLVALKLARREKHFFSVSQKQAFILAWLESASSKNLFNNDVESEIQWLKNKMNSVEVNHDPEIMLEHIYNLSHTAFILYCLKPPC